MMIMVKLGGGTAAIVIRRINNNNNNMLILILLIMLCLMNISNNHNNSNGGGGGKWLIIGAEAVAEEPQEKKGGGRGVVVKVGALLPRNDEYDDYADNGHLMSMSCIKMALSDFYATHPHFTTRIHLLSLPPYSPNTLLPATSAVLDLIRNEKVAAIIGSPTSPESQFVINVADRTHVPILSYSPQTTSLSPSHKNPSYFIQPTQNQHSSQVQPLAALVHHYGWKQVVPIYVSNGFNDPGFIPALFDAFQGIGARIPYMSVLPPSYEFDDGQLEAELHKLKSMQTCVFIVHLPPSLGSRLFLKADELRMMTQDNVWIITSVMANVLNSLNTEVIQSMHGVLGVKTYVPRTKELQNFNIRWKKQFQQQNPSILNPQINVIGHWAYDATTALARAVEQVGVHAAANFTSFSGSAVDNSPSPDLLMTNISSLGVSTAGQQLLQAILGTKFRGLSGNFGVVDGGELQSYSTYEYINIVGSGEKGIGYWTHLNGVVRELLTTTTTSSVSKSSKYSSTSSSSSSSNPNQQLGAVIWPGDHTSPVPKGWVTSPNGKKLRIVVPVKGGFSEFVNVIRDPITNTTQVTGYCIDVFIAVLNNHSFPYEFIPYPMVDGEPTRSYDDLIYQVYQKKYDAVVGDITIIANRAKYVDFTLPYTESGVVLVVPMREHGKKRAWLFVKPLTKDLWITTFCFFIFMAFVIWVLEHRINEDFRGPPIQQLGTSLYYSFSTMVFSHSFNVFGNSTRFVMIIWVFVVLILTQSYTANLASLLTVDQLQPTITDVMELQRRGETVGYQEGSFVEGLLKRMKFSSSQLKSFKTPVELDELLRKGTKNGGIAAAFDEIPYMKLFIETSCSKYTMLPPTNRTDGFGFAFPLGSPLTTHVSRSVLNIIEGDKMTDIENKWIKKQKNCTDSKASDDDSSSLSLDSFRGLFTIVGSAAVLALVISLGRFLQEHRHVWTDADSTSSVWSRIGTMIKMYDQRNLSSHTFRRRQPQDQSFVEMSSSTPSPAR